MSKSFCMGCKKEVNEDLEKCDCGAKRFVYGDNFELGENGVICGCGSDKFRTNMHMDYKHKSVNNYVCTECGSSVGIETYRSEEDLMYWD